MKKKFIIVFVLLMLFTCAIPFAASAADETQSAIDVVWLLVAAFLVFFMQAGFAMVETGLTAITGARLGLRTVLVEEMPFLGGMCRNNFV